MNAQLRAKGLGSSDAAAAVGLSKWKTPYQLWQEKLGTAPASNDAEALHLEMGHALEPVAIGRLERKMRLQVTSRNVQYTDPTWPQRWAKVDGMASDGALVEAKSVGFADPREWGDEFDDSAIPMEYLMQVQHGLACTGARFAWVPVIVLNRQFRIYRVQRDEELIGMLTEKEREFWGYVERREAPPPISAEDAYNQWPQDKGGTIECTVEAFQHFSKYVAAKARIKAAEMDADEAKLGLAQFMGANAVLVEASGKPILTWKTAKPSRKVDLDRLRAEHPDLVRQYEIEVPGSRRMLIK